MPNPFRLLAFTSPLALATNLAPIGHADPCTAMYDAMVVQAKVPYAVTINISGKQPTHAVMIGGTEYFETGGAWHSTPQPIEEVEARLEKARKEATATCQQEADAMVNGEATAVYAGRLTNQGSTSDNRLWVSKRTGLLLKSESHLAQGSVVTQTYSYDHVRAPEGAVKP